MKPTFDEIIRDNQLAIGKIATAACVDAERGIAEIGRKVWQEQQQAMAATYAAAGTLLQRSPASIAAEIGRRTIAEIMEKDSGANRVHHSAERTNDHS